MLGWVVLAVDVGISSRYALGDRYERGEHLVPAQRHASFWSGARGRIRGRGSFNGFENSSVSCVSVHRGMVDGCKHASNPWVYPVARSVGHAGVVDALSRECVQQADAAATGATGLEAYVDSSIRFGSLRYFFLNCSATCQIR